MTVYVDNSIFPYRGKLYCHMATDGDIEELHEMAAKIGMRRSWFQNHPAHPHYDLSPQKRLLAIRNGAIELDSFELIKKCFRKGKGE